MAFSILSLDGGGTWALIQARVFEKMYGPDMGGHEILRKFDLVIANSGGSLVLSMLCANKTPKQIVETFNTVETLQQIFKRKTVHSIPVLKDFLPNYETENKYRVFLNNLQNNGVSYGEKLMSELPELIGKKELQLIITNFDYDRERAVYFRSNMLSKMEGAYIENKINPGSVKTTFKTVTLAQAVHGASNAPVQFFEDPAAFPITTIHSDGSRSLSKDRLFWDGAVGGNNNPIKAGVLEALANFENRTEGAKQIRIVSIGTAGTIYPVLYNENGEIKPEYDWLCRQSNIDGFKGDLKRMASSIVADPPDSSSFEAHQILGLEYIQNDPRFIRINPLVKPVLKHKGDTAKEGWYIPGKENSWSPKEMEDLFEMDMAVATEYGVKLLNRLCDDFFEDAFDNQGIRIGGKKLDAILGHKTFSAALRDWQTWK